MLTRMVPRSFFAKRAVPLIYIKRQTSVAEDASCSLRKTPVTAHTRRPTDPAEKRRVVVFPRA